MAEDSQASFKEGCYKSFRQYWIPLEWDAYSGTVCSYSYLLQSPLSLAPMLHMVT